MEYLEKTLENGVAHNGNLATKNERPRVFIADDNTSMLETIVRLLTPHFEVAGTAQDGNAALDLIKRLKPDVAVLDNSMPFKTGIEVAADLKKSAPKVKVVIVSAYVDETFIHAAESGGALAFIAKMYLADQLVLAIHNAYGTGV